MTEFAILVLTIIGAVLTWTTSVIVIMVWLWNRFAQLSLDIRTLEKSMYRELAKHHAEDNERFDESKTRIQRLEINAFGFTKHP